MMKRTFEEGVEPIPDIETPRLRLVSMSAQLLRLLIERNHKAAEEIAGFGLPDDCPLPAPWAEITLRAIEQDPGLRAWLMHRAIVLKEDNQMIGHIRFHHQPAKPDPEDYVGAGAELGYTIAAEYRRRGYGKESAVAMMEWACRERGVSTFFLSISPSNSPSLKLAESMNFRKVAEKMDDIDGLEYIMKAEIHGISRERNGPGDTRRIEQ